MFGVRMGGREGERDRGVYIWRDLLLVAPGNIYALLISKGKKGFG